MRVTVVAVAPAAVVARDVGMPVGMTVCVAVIVVMRGDVNRRPRVTVGVVREGQVKRHQQRLHEQAQTDENSEESLHRVVPWLVLYLRRVCEDPVFHSSSAGETIPWRDPCGKRGITKKDCRGASQAPEVAWLDQVRLDRSCFTHAETSNESCNFGGVSANHR